MVTREILLVTNYFPPEQGAASNRMYSVAQAFVDKGYKVQVVCPLPNYPQGAIFEEFKGKYYSKTIDENITIHRLWLWPSNSQSKFVRLCSMLSFALSIKLFFLFKKTPRIIFIQYSPVFVGFTAVFWSWILRKKLLLNVSDLWPLAGLEMGLLKKGVYYSILQKMEHFCYRKADLIIGQSKEILTHVKKKYPPKRTFLYRNVPDFKTTAPKISISEKVTIVYAGLLGVAQGIDSICRSLDLPAHITLHIYGAGPEATKVKSLQKENIKFHGELSRTELHKVLQQYDIAFIPLINRIYGSVPSKIFEYTRLGLPVLYYAGGEGEDIVKENKLGWTVPVKGLEALQRFINALSSETLKNYPKAFVQKNSTDAFNFDSQFQQLIKIIEDI